MKKIMLGAALMALSVPAFAAPALPVSISSLQLKNLAILKPAALINASAINGLPTSAFEVLHLASGVSYLSGTPLYGLSGMLLHSSGHDGNS